MVEVGGRVVAASPGVFWWSLGKGLPNTEITARGRGEYQGTLEVFCVLCRPGCPMVGHPQVGGPKVESCRCGVSIHAANGGMYPHVLPVV